MTESTITRIDSDRAGYQNIGLFIGPAIFLVMLSFSHYQQTMSIEAWRTAAVGLWMAVWWATEAIPVPATAFLPIVTFDVLGIASVKEAAAPYANPTIYLFLGAFILALAVERWNLHKRVALNILARTGTDGKRLIGGFMLVAALLSMWMTNTSTTMMLLPIAISVVTVVLSNVQDVDKQSQNNFQVAMLLGLAFAATIGGLATLIGTPPNALLAAFLKENYAIEISFFDWMLVGVPLTAVMLPTAWIILTRWAFPVNIAENQAIGEHLKQEREGLGKISTPEKRVAIIFGLVVLGWVLRRPLSSGLSLSGLSDTAIAMAGALLLFFMPSGDKDQKQLMVWSSLDRLPWGVLILFGGGLSLAAAIASSGLAQWLGESLAPLSILGISVLVISATALVIFLTELTSNVATTATFLPVIGAIAIQSGIPPMMLCVPVTLAASCAFMLPVATPPNAVVFSSGMLTIPQMVRAGFYLNCIGMLLLTAVALWWAPLVFEIS
ncbi:MAG: sodium-dependent dicarboxylate transporter 2/3/5 [Porticoccaceae bacterium]|jgi:sodium-dependent dicarboxylate transporter 2/3/5